MKNTKILATIAALAVGSFTSAQSLSIYAEYGQIIASDGITVIDSVTSGWTGYFGFVTGASDVAPLNSIDIELEYLAIVDSVSWTSLVTFDPGGGGWFLSPNGAAFDPLADITTSNSDLAVGQKPLVLFTDAATVGGIGAGSQLIVAEGATFLTDNDNRSAYVGANAFTALAGTSGSLIAGTVVPEPSTYALLGGVFALGFVMWRRRR